MNVIKHAKNIHEIKLDGHKARIAMLSDIHWDNPKCDWDLLKKHLDYCVSENIPIMFNGDFFCLMQGKGDRRGNKSDIRPEHNNAKYLDSIVETAVEWFSPYAHLMTVVGYGNHECYRPDTEVLTSNGWKNIKYITLDDAVATFNDKSIYFEKPNALVSKHADKLVHIEGSYTKQVVSGKHAVMYNDMKKVNAEDITEMCDVDFPHKRIFNNELALSDNSMIELITCIVMDATIVDHSKYNPTHTKKRIQFKISKPEKIEYIKSVLERCNIPYTFKEATKSKLNKLQPYYIRIYGDYARDLYKELEGVKELPIWFSNIHEENFKSFLHALERTDGHKANSNTIEWNTTNKSDVNVVQMMCVLNGWNCTFKEKINASGFDNAKLQYHVRISEGIVKNKKAKIHHEEYSGEVFCLNMPSGCFVTRIDGKVAFSGNTAIIKWQETDVLQRFVDLLNYKNNTNVYTGGYGGWLVARSTLHGTSRSCIKIKYFHGSGGGGVVTKGALNLTRALEMYEGFDVFTMGHIHENSCRNDVRDTIDHSSKIGYRNVLKDIHLMLTGTYKEEYQDGSKGWHVERGAPPKPVGGRILTIDYKHIKVDGDKKVLKQVDSHKFPL
jgi:hypothetical protein